MKNNKIINSIAIYEILGWIYSLIYILISMIWYTWSIEIQMIIILLLIWWFNIFLILSWFLLYKNESKWFLYTKISQYIQVPMLTIYWFTYVIFAGIMFWFFIHDFTITFPMGIWASALIGIDSYESLNLHFWLNIIPLFILYYIHRYEKIVTKK